QRPGRGDHPQPHRSPARGHRGGQPYPGRAHQAAQGPRRRTGPRPRAAPARRSGHRLPRGGDPVNLIDETRALLADAHDLYRGTPQAAHLDVLAARLEQPLRIAVAGRVKAGKSTLLNALIGDRLAPTDAGECTRIVTWYQDGHTYRVLAHPATGGTARQLRFHRDGGALHIDLGDLAPDTVSHLEVTWPSRALRTATMIDTPGIGSLSDRTSARTWDTLAPAPPRATLPPDTEDDTPADAVTSLRRHLHRDDLDFLHAFPDTEVSRPNPVNAIAVLSRADEIGVGRLDAMASARRIAHRMA